MTNYFYAICIFRTVLSCLYTEMDSADCIWRTSILIILLFFDNCVFENELIITLQMLVVLCIGLMRIKKTVKRDTQFITLQIPKCFT